MIPLRAFHSNPIDGLAMTLLQAIDLSATGCPASERRLKIIIHPPADFPRVGHKFINVPANQELKINIKPLMMTTSPHLVKYPVATRQCFFNSDRSLQFFKYYSQSNCNFECLTNFTIMMCGCARMAMPRDNLTRVCMLKDRSCINKCKYLFDKKSLEDLDNFEERHFREHFGLNSEQIQHLLYHSCECLPSCVSLHYEITTLPLLLDDQNEIVFPNSKESRVMIFFEDTQFLKSKRSEIYDWGDFIANCGGLLGNSFEFSARIINNIFFLL